MPSKLCEWSTRPVESIGSKDFDAACHYAWGWQDRDGSADSTVAMRFAECWSLYRKLYGGEAIGHMSPMRDAWEQFDRDGQIAVDHYAGGDWVIRPDGLRAAVLPVPSVRKY